MTAPTDSIETIKAILKTRYDSDVPKLVQEEFPAWGSIPKFEQEFGYDFVLAVYGENPQGVGSDIESAVTSITAAGGSSANYLKFQPNVVESSGVVRWRNNILRRAKSPGALLDVVKSECDGMLRMLIQEQSIDVFNDGTGIKGTVGSVSGSVVTLTVPTDALKFSVGENVVVLTDRTTSPTNRGTCVLSGVDPVAGTLSIASGSWPSTGGATQATDLIARSGREASGGAFRCAIGYSTWLAGGSSPGTLWGLNRNQNPAKYAGTALNCLGKPLEEALIEASTYSKVYGTRPADTLYCHPLDWADLVKSLSSKVKIEKTTFVGSKAGIGFSAIMYDSPGGEITVILTPFCPKNSSFLVNRKMSTWHSAGPSPRLLKDGDGMEIVRLVGTSYLEAQFGSDVQFSYRQPYSGVRMYNFGLVP